MEDSSPFSQHLDTNYVPTSQEIDALKALIEERQVVIDSIDAEIAVLVKKRANHIQYVREHQALATTVRRLPDDILLSIFFESLGLAKPWPSQHPAVTASHVCRRWRGLALGSPLLWTKIDLHLPWKSMEEELRKSEFQDALRHDNMEAYLLRCIPLCRPYIDVAERRVQAFIQRSSGCPLSLRVTGEDIPRGASTLRLLQEWRSLLDPLCESMSEPITRWEDVNLNLIVSPDSPISLRFLKMPVASSGLGMRGATLRVQTYSSNLLIPDGVWNAVLPGGKIDLHLAQLRTFSVLMSYADMSRIQTSWDGLTTLAFGSPSNGCCFLPSEALGILRLTPNLIHGTIHLSYPPIRQVPHLDPLTLAHLESLTVVGDVPPRAFAEALRLPTLTRLYTARAIGPPESEVTGSVFQWIQRHGTQLKEISVPHSSLTKPALSIALKNLPNIESLELVWNPTSEFGRQVNTHANGFSEVDFLGELGDISMCLCPKLRTLVCGFYNGGGQEKRKAIVDFIEKRRSMTRPSSIAWLGKIDITFLTLPARSIWKELERRGVDTEGISIPTT